MALKQEEINIVVLVSNLTILVFFVGDLSRNICCKLFFLFGLSDYKLSHLVKFWKAINKNVKICLHL